MNYLLLLDLMLAAALLATPFCREGCRPEQIRDIRRLLRELLPALLLACVAAPHLLYCFENRQSVFHIAVGPLLFLARSTFSLYVCPWAC